MKKWVPFTLMMILLLSWAVLNKPKLYGDGHEYLMMVASLSNHFTPNQIDSDVQDRNIILDKNNILKIDAHAGYFKDLSGSWYSYHFWFYPLLSLAMYSLLHLLNMNELSVFQVTNVILMGWLVWTILQTTLDRKSKIWMLVGLINPIWLYVPWSHPEVFTFVLLFISLIKWAEQKPVQAALFSAIASWQNPGVAIITAIISIRAIMDVIVNRKFKQFILTGVSASLVLLPYVWYWMHYHLFSIVGKTYTGSISLEKTASLFLDPNFGMFWYVPILMICLVYQLFKLDRKSIIAAVSLLLVALICSVQLNWNSGNIWINRYAVWMIPLLIYGSLKASYRWANAAAIIQGTVLILCVVYYQDYSTVKFTPLAKKVMAIAPELYNPPYEVFVERSLEYEVNERLMNEGNSSEVNGDLPITIIADSIRKTLNKEMKYINSGQKLDLDEVNVFTFKPKGSDINNVDINLSFDGVYALENWNGKNARWMTRVAKISFLSNDKQAHISFLTGSFDKERNVQILFNGEPVYDGKLSTDQTEIRFNKALSNLNTIEIKTNEQIPRIADVPEYKSEDPRSIAFYMMELNVISASEP